MSKEKKTNVLVIGAGITGIQSSLDLADKGYRVYLVEKSPSIGGSMAKLDKTFPTNDCSMCTLAPKMVETSRHPNIELLTYSEVVGLEGTAGNFKAKIKKKPRYVIEEKCTGCGDCIEKCPTKKQNIPSEFDHGMGTRKAIYIPFEQASPLVATIDTENCLHFKTGKCGICQKVCLAEAIDFEQKEEIIEVDVGAVIVATGFDVLAPTMRTEYGYGKYKNVITAIEYERLMSASGPTRGHIERPSDGKKPEKIAWIQCVGSRSGRLGNPYCSRVCCMYATKEALVTKEHDPDIQPYIFYMDLRAYGKEFEEYYQKADSTGVKYVRARPAEVFETDGGDIMIRYEDTYTGEIKEEKFDLLVLSSAIVPSKSNAELSESLGIELDENGFFKECNVVSDPMESSKPGVFLAGCSQSPKDIPDSVAQGSGAAAMVMDILPKPEIKPVQQIAEKVMQSDEEPRIGVFICMCGKNIAGYMDVDKLSEFALSLPNVSHSEILMFACSQDAQGKIKKAIESKDLNRVVVAACTPRTHEGLFQDTIREIGLNKYLFEMANIRNQCSWVHSTDPEKALEKAKELVKMSVAKARLLEPLSQGQIEVEGSALVIGGGVSGMSTALALAEAGIKVYLVEKKDKLGGMLNNLTTLYPSDVKAQDVVDKLVDEMQKNKNIDVLLNTEIEEIKGYIGNFEVEVKEQDPLYKNFEEPLKVGTVVIATGAELIDPAGIYGYGSSPKIITQYELEEMLKKGSFPKDAKEVLFISCAGAREDKGRTYCCRVGCGTMLRNAKALKKLNPDLNLFVLFRDMRSFGKREEEYYVDVQQNYGVKFLRYEKDQKPEVSVDNGVVTLRVHDMLLGDDLEFKPDLVVLTTPTEGQANDIAMMLKVPTSKNGGFFLEAHAKIRPLDFATDGVYVCGSAHFPKGVADAVAQAIGAASRAAVPIFERIVKGEAIVSDVDQEKCIGCGICVSICPYGAMALDDGKSQSNKALCKGCGTCASACPMFAIKMPHFTDGQIFEQIKAAIGKSGGA
ncbi:MAG: CoB--CoM heterodisulfide reductase iron-sulfur subunit A family protein [Candidatus Methanofastidiosa archaeon]|nr:CoB--CoM heterodisulfide reductase iron-sulfur subunit A family protein [Candidatus Methanofastidiosa archaeon]